jgi:hypothetical protein
VRPALPLTLHQSTGLPDYDAAAWSSLPPVRGLLRGEEGWGVLLQEPDQAPQGFRAVEVAVPETSGAVLLLGLAAGVNEGRLSGTGAARAPRVRVRRGEALLVPPGVGSLWHSNTGQERVLHLHLPGAFLARTAEGAEMVARPELLPAGTLRRDPTLDLLLRHIVRQLREGEPGWRLAVRSAVTLIAVQLLGAAAPQRPRRRAA